MSNFTPEEKQPIMKSLALLGLVGVIIFIAWLAIQIVQVFPSALSSIASIANSVYNYNPALVRDLPITSNQTMVNSGEKIVLSWEEASVSGTYTLSYRCLPGLTVTITAGEQTFDNARCDETYDLGLVNSATLTVSSSQDRYVDLEYKLSFMRPNATTPAAERRASITIVNPVISTSTPGYAGDTSPEFPTVDATTKDDTTSDVVVTPQPEPTAPAPVGTPTPTRPTAPSQPVYVYQIPVSQPNGTADLAVTYLGLGAGSSVKSFSPTASLYTNKGGALQFAVHNIGNKTSERWTWEAKLPGGTTYTSPAQTPLKPNERAVITVEFPTLDKAGLTTFSVTVDVLKDKNEKNNSFSRSTVVLKN